MKIYLQEKDGAWKPYEGTLDSLSGELKSREKRGRGGVGAWQEMRVHNGIICEEISDTVVCV